jgi:organic radical activating enzyme
MSAYDYNYCVYLQNFPYIDNSGMIFPCCKNRTLRLPQYNIKDMKLKDMYNIPEFAEMRKQMASGQMPQGCDPCYNEEAAGVKDSFRVRNLKGLKVIAKEADRYAPYTDNIIRGLDLRLGSTCNLTCTMCYPSDSNSWHKIFEDYAREVTQETENAINITMNRYEPKKQNWAEFDQSWENIFCSIDDNLRRVYLAGGEPFYIKNFEEYLLEMYSRSPQASFEINTNATRILPDKYVNKFKQVNLRTRVSIDGIGKFDEWIRQGTVWEEKVEVIDQYSKLFDLSFDITLSSFNIQNLPDTINWLQSRYPDARILVRPVTSRKGMEIESIPKEMRQPVIDYLKSINTDLISNVRQIMGKLKLDFVDRREEQQRILKFWEARSKVKYSETNEQLYRWINENYSS